MSPNLDAAKIIWPSVAAIFPRNPIILLIDVYSLLRRVVVDGLAADDNADDDNEDGGGGGVGCNLNEIQAKKKKTNGKYRTIALQRFESSSFCIIVACLDILTQKQVVVSLSFASIENIHNSSF